MNPYYISYDDSINPKRQDDRVTEVTFTLPAGHKWTTVEAALREAHDVEANLRIEFQLENARLRKAGDAMAIIIRPPAHGLGEHDSEWLDWQAAKWGKQTE